MPVSYVAGGPGDDVRRGGSRPVVEDGVVVGAPGLQIGVGRKLGLDVCVDGGADGGVQRGVGTLDLAAGDHEPAGGHAAGGDDPLLGEMNAAIKALRENGTYKAINDKYFAFDVFGG